jgi:hypothetical protein
MALVRTHQASSTPACWFFLVHEVITVASKQLGRYEVDIRLRETYNLSKRLGDKNRTAAFSSSASTHINPFNAVNYEPPASNILPNNHQKRQLQCRSRTSSPSPWPSAPPPPPPPPPSPPTYYRSVVQSPPTPNPAPAPTSKRSATTPSSWAKSSAKALAMPPTLPCSPSSPL